MNDRRHGMPGGLFKYSYRKENRYAARKKHPCHRGIPRTPSFSSLGFGSNWDHSTLTINADLGRDEIDVADGWVYEANMHSEKIYAGNIRNIVRITDARLASTKTATGIAAKPGTDALTLELSALNSLLSSIKTEHQQQIKAAHLFFGHDPLTHKPRHASYLKVSKSLLARRTGNTSKPPKNGIPLTLRLTMRSSWPSR